MWSSDLKFLNVNATIILGTSNPPHECGESEIRKCLGHAPGEFRIQSHISNILKLVWSSRRRQSLGLAAEGGEPCREGASLASARRADRLDHRLSGGSMRAQKWLILGMFLGAHRSPRQTVEIGRAHV